MDADLSALRALADAATPGEWKVSDERECEEPHFASILSHADPKKAGGFPEVAILNGGAPYRDGEGMANAAFIAAARSAVPRLLDEVERLLETERVREATIKTALDADTTASEVKLWWYSHNASTDMSAGTLSCYWAATVYGLIERVKRAEASRDALLAPAPQGREEP